MPLAINIHELIHGQVIEWERLEFKQGWNPEDVMHTLSAFANDINNWGGGYLVIGIAEDKGRPVLPPAGLHPDRIDKIQGEITNLCHKLQPNYLPIVQPYAFQDRHILVLYAPAGDMRPYSAPEGLGTKGLQQRAYYIRSGSRSIKARGENLRRLQALAARIPFDDRVNPQANLDDLNLGLIRDFLQEIKSDLAEESVTMPFADLCQQMNIARGPNEALRPLNAGLMFFCPAPERFFHRAWIEVVIRRDEAGKDFDEKYFQGPLHVQLRNALSYIRTNVITEKVKKISGQAEAQRAYNFPYEAVEEALANAVYHKSYELDKPIEVQIWPDMIEILSFPGPVPPVNAQILAENQRIVARDYRNRRVGDFLKELHLTEGRGTGIPTIKRAMERNQSPPPVFETDDACTYFLTTLPVNPEAKGIVSDHVNDRDSNYVSNQDSNYVSNQNKKLLAYAAIPRSREELLTFLGLNNQSNNYKRHIEPLLHQGWITMTIPDKPRSRNQRYRLTPQGEAVLKK